MAAFQNFRSALNGFNREDVVHYIEFVNNKHSAQVNQLNTEIQSLRAELDTLHDQTATPDLASQLEEVQAINAALEKELAQLREQLEQAQNRPKTDNELEAYRRAERAERIANERVTQLYDQANGVLADATVRTDEAAARISKVADSIAAQLSELQAALASGKNTLKDTAAAMYAIHPIATQE
ncbi:MAG: hypothetical protein J6Q53_02420 [Oscillospiraceae bacterium]|nr:hypothetical protein [Oscillospiraceae bacterium]